MAELPKETKVERGVEKGLNQPAVLSKDQKEVLDMLCIDFLPVKEIAKRRQTSDKAIYKLIKKLKDKGYLLGGVEKPKQVSRGVENLSTSSNKGEWGYHALHVVASPYYFSPLYAQTRTKKGNLSIIYRDWQIHLNTETVEFQLREGFRFSHKDKWTSITLARDSLNKAISYAEQRFGFNIFKEGKANIRLVRQHLAFGVSGIAKAMKREFLCIRAEDGRVWFQIDKSKGHEHEYTHGGTCIEDSEKVEPYFNDMKDNSPPTNSELLRHLTEVAKNQAVYNENIKLHLKTLEDMRLTLRAMRGEGKRFLSQPSRPRSSSQSSLRDYFG